MIKYFGNEDGKHQLFETEEGALLDFQGPDAERFVQLHRPEFKKTIAFNLTEKKFLDLIASPQDSQGPSSWVEPAAAWEIGECEEGHTVMTLLDDAEKPFAEAHIGDRNDVNHLILDLIASCREHTLERLRQLIVLVSASGSFGDPDQLGLAVA